MENNFKSKTDAIKTALFVAVMAIFAFIGLLFFLRPTVSETEKRELTKFPEFTLESFLSGEFTSQVSLWFADTYPLREGMISANSSLESLYGFNSEQIVMGGDADDIPDTPSDPSDVVFNPTDDGSGEKVSGLYVNADVAYQLYSFNEQNSKSYVALINNFATRVDGKAQVYDLIAPLHYQIALSVETAQKYGASDGEKAIDYMYSLLSDSVTSVDALSEMRAHNGEYLYFRTDHHWTARGAYYAFVAFCEAKGIEPTALESYESLRFDGFLGTLYSEANQPAAMKNNPDFVEAFVPMGTNEITVTERGGNVVKYQVVNKQTNSWYPAAGAKYNCFIAGDNPLSEIHNPSISDGSSIVVVKESYGNAFIPFLVDSYEYVYVIDYRYWSSDLADFVIEGGIDDVLFLNVVSNTSTSTRLSELADILQ
ncbi:MAG: hypothetical protein E7592_01230 [Ruminococcaceae bacterium]|nr:hypothetical protein [Oscillospiraceae bacterium]